MMDLYAVLNVDAKAKFDDIKQQYHRLLLQYHPDKNPKKNTKAEFEKIHLAYNILKNESTRKIYDASASGITIWDEISIHDMDVTDEIKGYMYSCRCGGSYVFEHRDSETGMQVELPCDTCSLYILVNIP